ncbi:MAG: aldehyde dehydrogenase family protein [Chryseobacterium sp.]|nr:MAG: aldehyde dehydrogenase family protein [Chryseobacterium sp.]
MVKNCKSPAIVHSTADLDKAAGRIMRRKISNSGQDCSSLDYLSISKFVEEEFISKCKNLVREAFYHHNTCDLRNFPQYMTSKILNV